MPLNPRYINPVPDEDELPPPVVENQCSIDGDDDRAVKDWMDRLWNDFRTDLVGNYGRW